MALTDKLSAIGSAIREKTGGTELLTLDAMPTEIASIQIGGADLSGALLADELSTYSNLEITALRTYAFAGATSLVSVDLPNVSTVGGQAFMSCGIKEIVLPALVGVGSSAFRGSNLEKIDLPIATSIGLTCFTDSLKLTTLILRNENICALTNVNAFTRTDFASGGTGGEIYIPKVLYDALGTGSELDYKSATNWATIDAYGTITWKQIEGSEYE